MKRKKIIRTQEGYVAKNFSEWKFDEMSFMDTIKEAHKWKNQKIMKVKITFYEI
jgi:hypothetical protein